MNEEGGAALSFDTLKLAALVILGATVGGLVLATWILSRLLCPGTPSNVFPFDFFTASSPLTPLAPFALLTPLWFEVPNPVEASEALLIPPCAPSGFCPNLKLAALVILGATAGGAVDATLIVSDLLCPGTFANVFARLSLVAATRFGASRTIP